MASPSSAEDRSFRKTEDLYSETIQYFTDHGNNNPSSN
jgi:hypothetical protein